MNIVLDTSLGRPARGVEVIIQKAEVESGNTIFRDVASGCVDHDHVSTVNINRFVTSSTDSDGRCSSLLEPGSLITAGVYKVIFKTQEYFKVTHRDCFYPFVEVRVRLFNQSFH